MSDRDAKKQQGERILKKKRKQSLTATPVVTTQGAAAAATTAAVPEERDNEADDDDLEGGSAGGSLAVPVVQDDSQDTSPYTAVVIGSPRSFSIDFQHSFGSDSLQQQQQQQPPPRFDGALSLSDLSTSGSPQLRLSTGTGTAGSLLATPQAAAGSATAVGSPSFSTSTYLTPMQFRTGGNVSPSPFMGSRRMAMNEIEVTDKERRIKELEAVVVADKPSANVLELLKLYREKHAAAVERIQVEQRLHSNHRDQEMEMVNRELQDAAEKLQMKNSEIAELKKEHEEQLQFVESSKKQLKERANNVEKAFGVTDASLKNAKEQVKQLEADVAALKAQLEASQSELRQQVDVAVRRATASDLVAEELREIFISKENDAAGSAQTISALSLKLEQTVSQHDQLAVANTSLAQQLAAAQAENQASSTQVHALQAQLAQVTASDEAHSSELDQTKQDLVAVNRQLADVSNTVQQRTQELDQTKQALVARQAALQQLEDQLQGSAKSAHAELVAAKQQVATLESELAAAKQTSSALESDNGRHEAKVHELSQQVAQLTSSQQSLAAAYAVKQEEVQALQQDNQATHEAIQSLQQDNQAKLEENQLQQKEIAEFKQASQAKQEEILALKQELATTKQAKQEEADMLKQELAVANQSMQGETQALQQANQAKQEEIQALKQANQTKQEEVLALQQANRSAQQEIQALHQSKQQEINHLMQELASAHQSSQAEIQALKQQLDAAKSSGDEIQSLAQELAAVSQSKQHLEQLVEQLESRHGEHSDAVHAKELELEHANAQNVQLESLLSSARSQIDSLGDQVAASKHAHEQTKHDLEARLAEMAQAHAQLQASSAEQAEQLAELRHQNETIGLQLSQQVATAAENASARAALLQIELEKERAKASVLDAKLIEVTREKEQTQRLFAEQLKQSGQDSVRLKTLDGALEQTKIALQQLTSERNKLQSELSFYQDNNDEQLMAVTAELELHRADIARLNALTSQNEALLADMDKLRQALVAAEAQKKEHAQQIDSARQDLVLSESQKSQFAQQNEALLLDIDSVRRDLAAAEAQKKQLVQQKEYVEKELAAVQAQLAERPATVQQLVIPASLETAVNSLAENVHAAVNDRVPSLQIRQEAVEQAAVSRAGPAAAASSSIVDDLHSLEDLLSGQDAHSAALSAQVQQLTGLVAEKDIYISQLTEAVRLLEDNMASQLAAEIHLSSTLTVQQSAIAEHESQIARYTNQVHALSLQASKVQQENDELNATVTVLTTELHTSEAKLIKLQSVEEQLIAATAELEHLAAQESRLKGELSAQQSSLVESADAQQAALRGELKAAKSVEVSLQTMLSAAQSELSNVRGQLAQSQQEKASTDQELSTTAEELRSLRTRAAEQASEIAAKAQELTDTKAALDALSSKATELEALRSQADQELAAKNAELEALRSQADQELAAKNAEIQALRSKSEQELAAKNAEIEALQSRVDEELSARAAEIQALRSRAGDHASASAETAQELASTKAALQALRSKADQELAAKVDEIQTLHSQHTSASTASAQELASTKAALQALRAQAGEQASAHAAAVQELTNTKAALQALRAKADQELAAKTDEIQALRAKAAQQAAASSATVQELAITKAALESKAGEQALANAFREQLAESASKYQQLDQDVQQLRVANAHLQHSLAEKTKALEDLEETTLSTAEDLQTSLNSARTQASQLTQTKAELAQLQHDYVALESQLADANSNQLAVLQQERDRALQDQELLRQAVAQHRDKEAGYVEQLRVLDSLKQTNQDLLQKVTDLQRPKEPAPSSSSAAGKGVLSAPRVDNDESGEEGDDDDDVFPSQKKQPSELSLILKQLQAQSAQLEHLASAQQPKTATVVEADDLRLMASHVEELRQSYQNEVDANTSLRALMAEVRRKFADQAASLRQQEEQIRQLREGTASVTVERDALKQQVAQEETAIRLGRELSSLSADLRALHAAVTRLITTRPLGTDATPSTIAQNLLEDLTALWTKQRTEADQLDKTLRDKTRRISDLEKDLEDARARAATDIERMRLTSEQQLKIVQTQSDSQRREFERLSAIELKRQQDEDAATKARLQRAQEQVLLLETQVQQEKRAHVVDLSKLESQLQHERRMHETEVSTLTLQNEALRQMQAKPSPTPSSSVGSDAVALLRSQLADVTNQLQHEASRAKQLQAECDRLLENNTELISLNSLKLTDKDKAAQQMQERIDQLLSELVLAKSQLNNGGANENALVDSRSHSGSSTSSTDRRNATAMADRINALNVEKRVLQERVGQLQQQASTQRDLAQQYYQDVQTLREHLRRTQTQLDIAVASSAAVSADETEVLTLTMLLTERTAVADKLAAARAAAELKCEQLQSQVTAYAERLARATTQLATQRKLPSPAAVDSELRRLRTENEHLAAQIEHHTSVGPVSEIALQLQDAMALLSRERKSHTEDKKSLTKQVNSLKLRLRRESSMRADLTFQKRYLMLLAADGGPATLEYVSSIPLSPLMRFRAAVSAVIAAHRLFSRRSLEGHGHGHPVLQQQPQRPVQQQQQPLRPVQHQPLQQQQQRPLQQQQQQQRVPSTPNTRISQLEQRLDRLEQRNSGVV